MEQKASANVGVGASVRLRPAVDASAKATTLYRVVCRDADGREKWIEEFRNIVTTQGLNHILDVVMTGATQVSPWYLGLKADGTDIVAGDTLASFGFTEFTDYTGNRQAFVEGTPAAGSVDNVGNVAVFPITGGGSIEGAFLCSVATGTSGTLSGGGNFASTRTVAARDSVEVTCTVSVASA
jgi:hypothetical protein